jgi:mycoredoxin
MQEERNDPCDVKIVAYITTWCPDCNRSRRVLQRLGFDFIEIDIEKIPGSEEAMRAINGGSGKVPTIVISGPGIEWILVEPGDRELADALRGC